MAEVDRDFWQCVRTFLIRYSKFNREKGIPSSQCEEFEQAQSRMLGQQLKEVVINKICGLQFKNDYHNIILLVFLQDIAKWSKQYQQALRIFPAPVECLLSQSVNLLGGQQQFHTIVPKQNELICQLLTHPVALANLQQFRVFYRKLKDVKEFYPSAVRQAQKQSFLRCIEDCIEIVSKHQNIKVIQFIFGSIFCELEILQDTHEYVNSRLRILKTLIRKLWLYHEEILHKTGFILIKFSQNMIANPHLFSYAVTLYEVLLEQLLRRDSITPLLLFKHLILENVSKMLQTGGQFLILEVLLNQLASIFQTKTLTYFLRNYDWNFLEVPVCQDSLHLLYDYAENRAHQKKFEHQMVRKHLKMIGEKIHTFLKTHNNRKQKNQHKWTFYQLKRRQSLDLIEEMNEKPKKLFKKIQLVTNSEIRLLTIKKIARIIKKAANLHNKAMIDLLASDNVVSSELFAEYVEMFIEQCGESNLQEFIRLFTSNFFLSGESQQIERVIDKLTQLYFLHQPQDRRILSSSDAVYTFANAIIILNTDLHNPKNEQKISEESFLKMCRKINCGEDLPLQILRKTYTNIKRNKINTFRDRGNVIGISCSNWLLLCCDYQANTISYADPQLSALDEDCFITFSCDLLNGIVDEKETAKLEALIERFQYDDRIFECEVVQTVRRLEQKKPHLPLHVLQKILEIANFKNAKSSSDKLLSYYWLAAQIIINFHSHLPTNLLCQFLVFNWNLRCQIQDQIYLRQVAELRRIKKSVRFVQKRDSKKSIMDMFSSFLSSKDSDTQENEPPAAKQTKCSPFRTLAHSVFEVIKTNPNHRHAAIGFLIGYIHGEQSRLFEQFVSCLCLLFNLLHGWNECMSIGEDLFYQILGLKESEITRRIDNLQKKDVKKHLLLVNYCSFWVTKILFAHYPASQSTNQTYLLGKSLDFLNKCDKIVLADLVRQLEGKEHLSQELVNVIQTTAKKIFQNINQSEIKWFFDKFVHRPEEKTSQKLILKSQKQINSENNIQKPLQRLTEQLHKNLQKKQKQLAQTGKDNNEKTSQEEFFEPKGQVYIKQNQILNTDLLMERIEYQIQEGVNLQPACDEELKAEKKAQIEHNDNSQKEQNIEQKIEDQKKDQSNNQADLNISLTSNLPEDNQKQVISHSETLKQNEISQKEEDQQFVGNLPLFML